MSRVLQASELHPFSGMDVPWLVDPTELKSKCKNTPFDEARMTGRVVRTVVAGRTVYEYA